MPVNYVQTFAMPSEYERQAAEARRRQAMAEALEAQAYRPLSGSEAATPAAAPLVMALQGYLSASQRRKAMEAAQESEKLGRREAKEYLKSFEPEKKRVDVSQVTAMEAPTPFVDEQGRVNYQQPSIIAAPNQRLMPAMGADGQPDFSQQMQMEVGGPLSMAQRRARALEGFESTNPLIQSIAESQYEASKPKTRELKIGDIDPSKFTPESIAAALKSGDVGQLKMLAAKTPDERTSSIKEYEYAKDQGFTGTLADWERQNRAAGATRIIMPTEGERKDSYNLNRIVSAQQRIRNAVEKDPTAIAPSGKEAFVSAIPGASEYSYLSQSPQRQVVSAAQAEIVDAILTLATGLSYTPVQLEAQRAAYLPKWNESEESRAAKYKALESLVDSARVRAGNAWTPEMDRAVEEAFKPITPKPPQSNQFSNDQQRRLDELERKALQRGTGGPK